MTALTAALLMSAAAAQELRRSGFVGVRVVAVPDTVRIELGTPPGIGVFVQALVDGGSAKAAGIEPNDVITAVGDHAVTGVADFVQLAKALRAGDRPDVHLRRGQQTLTLPVIIQPRPYEQSADARVTYDAITADGSLRRTIVTAPRQPGRSPAVLFIGGIGCLSEESLDLTSNTAKLLYGLTRAGFVTMRVEKSGVGDSEGPPCENPSADFRAEIRGYLAGLRALKRYDFVDADSVFLLGLSVGGVEAPLIASDEPVRGLVVINTVAKPFLEYLIDTRRRQMLLAHRPYDEIDRGMRLDEACNHQLLIEKRTPDVILTDTPSCADHITYPAPFTFVQQWSDVNPAEAWKAVNRPVLILYGRSDFVATNADHPFLAEMINSFHPGTATLEAIAGMDHGLSKAATMDESFKRAAPGDFEPAVLTAITAWLRGAPARKPER